jgi:hypothetical protein
LIKLKKESEKEAKGKQSPEKWLLLKLHRGEELKKTFVPSGSECSTKTQLRQEALSPKC